MNYIWDVIVAAQNNGVNLKDIVFKCAEIYSPYMELSNENINFKEIEQEVELNPYYRFFDIFKYLFDQDYEENQELKEVLFDILIHFLAWIDTYQGMDKVEYHKKFIYQELENAYFGQEIKDGLKYFNIEERNILIENIYKFYISGDHLNYLKDSIERIFKNSLLYTNKELSNEVLLYINRSKTKENLQKLKVIQHLFLPINFDIIVYWKDHFGIIGVKETMKIDQIAIY
ncbi:iron-dependent peroxidase [Orenia metallireducens]|uniref:Iron-dependent peroxidase n=1 Tax=Orenia metallireducens TaxID=1413210 RepID=A0A1C0A595_9FIRM|nr:iron-dependent peroxidase [Orenia metallireducens]OCL25312.1 iron-dependent peroxidase [Orenia metallireducens]